MGSTEQAMRALKDSGKLILQGRKEGWDPRGGEQQPCEILGT